MCQLVFALRLLATEHSVAVVVSIHTIYLMVLTRNDCYIAADQQYGVRRRSRSESETSSGSDLGFCA